MAATQIKIQSAPRPANDIPGPTEAYLLTRLQDIVGRIPQSAALPGMPDLLDCVDHLLNKYIELERQMATLDEQVEKFIQDQSIATWSDIAQGAYEAYGQTTGFKNFQGNPMPEWVALPPKIQIAWIAAAQQVARDFKIRHAQVDDKS